MNKHLYRLVWRHCRVDVVPAPETARQSPGAPASRVQRARCGTRSSILSYPVTRVCLACLALLGAAAPAPVWAACATAGNVVTCSGAANPLAPSYANAANNLQVNVNSSAGVGVLLGIGGTAMSLTGNNVTLVNGGTIDPSLLGGIGVLASGTVIGNANAGGSTQTVTNNAIMRGTVGPLGVNLPGLTGLALTVQNAAGGTTIINNSGTLGATPLLGVSLTGTGSAPVVAAYGGGAVNFSNTGTVLGRIAFQANATPGAGNTLTNEGALSGSVSLGTNSTNTFTAVTGSTVDDGGSTGLGALTVTGFDLGFAATGVIDGGAGGVNSLILRNSANNATTTGSGTLNGASYLNFSQATVSGGTWTLIGPLAVTATTLNGGLTIFDNPGSLGTGSLTVNGGALQAASSGLGIALPVTLGANGLTVSGANPLAFSNTVTGSGGVSLTGTGNLTLSGNNTYSGGTSLTSGTLIAGSSTALGSGTVQVSGTSGVLDASASVTLANPVAIGGGSTLTFGGSAPLTLAGQITGSGSVTKQGAQTVTLTGANTFSGGINVAAGALALSGPGSLQIGGTPLTLSGAGAVFDMSNADGDRAITGLSGVANTQVHLGSHNLTLGNSAGGTFAGTISGTGGIIKTNGDTQTFSGANTFTGGTTINAGGIALGSGGSLASTGAVSLLGGGTTFDISQASAQTIGALTGIANTSIALGNNALTFGDATDQTFSGVFSGSGGSIVKQGTGTMTLTGTNTSGGGINVRAGTLVLQGSAFANATPLALSGNGATLDLSAAAGMTFGTLSGVNGSTVLIGNQTLTIGAAGNSTFGGTISGAGGIVKQGSGSLLLSGAQTFTGGIDIASGRLALQGNNTLTGSNVVTVADNATFDIGGAGPVSIGSLTGTSNSQVTLGSNTLTLGDAASATFAGSIGGTGGIVKLGAGTQTLTGQNAFTGQINIEEGTLALSGTGTLSANPVSLAGGATLDISSGENQTVHALSGAAGSTIRLGSNTLSFGDNSDQTFAGTLTGNGGGIVKFGTGTQTLTAQQTFTGSIVVGGGALVIGAGGGLSPQNAITLGDSTTSLDISAAGAQTIGSLSGGAAQVFLGANTLTFGDGNGETFNGSIHGTGALVKQGGGVETLAGASDFTGGVDLAAGGLQLGNANAIGTGALTMADQTTLDTTQVLTLGKNITLNGTSAILGSNDLTLTGDVSGSGSLQKTGAATLTLNGAGGWTGGTTINDGVLALGAGGSLANQGAVVLNSPTAVFDVSGASGAQTIGALSGTGGTVTLGANTLTFGDASDQTLAATLSGTGGIVKQGAGRQTLTTTQTFAGGIDVANGTLALGSGASMQGANALTLSGAGSTFDISEGGTTVIGALNGVAGSSVSLGSQNLTFGGNVDASFGGAIHGAGALIKTGAGAQTFLGASDFSGGMIVGEGGLVAGDNLAFGIGALTLNSNASLDSTQAITLGNNMGLSGTLTVLGGHDLTLNGVLSGSGGLTKIGAARLTLGGSNTYTGATIVDAGTLALGAGASLNASGSINIASGATLDLSAGNGTQVMGAIDGAGTVNIGALVTEIGAASNGTFSGSLMGTGSVIKIGTGTETLTGQNTYTGGTVVQTGTLALGGAGTLAAEGALTLNNAGSTFNISGANGPQTVGALSAGAGTQIRLGGNTLTFGDATSHTVAALISGSGGIVKQGSGTTTVLGAQQYTGTTTITDGTLAIGSTGNLGTGAVVALASGSAVLDVSAAGNQSLSHLSGTGGSVVLGGGSTLRVGNNDTSALASAISGTGALIMDGSGRLTLGGVNTFTGNVGVDSGTLALGAGATLSSANDVTLASGATFDVSAATAPVIGSLNGAAGSTVNAGTQTLTLGSAGNGTFTGTLNGTGGLIKQGSGTQMLDSGAALTGDVRIDAGTLALSNGTRLNGNAITLDGATGRLDLSAGPNQTVGSIAGVTGSAINLGNAALTLADAASDALASDVHGAGGSLVKLGNGVQTLAGNNDFGGGIDVQAGGIAVNSNTALGTGVARFADGTSLDATQTSTLGNQIMLDGNLSVVGTNDLALNGAISGVGGITKNGAATLTLNGQNTYAGTTNVIGGTLALGAGASLDAAGIVNVATGAMFDLSAGNGTQTFGALMGGGAINMGSNTLEVGANGLDETYSGGVMGSGSLVKVGTGTETMTGTNTFTGGTVVQAGTLALGGAGSLSAAGAVTLQNPGTTLDISGANGNRTIGALTAQTGTNVTLGNNTLTFGDASSHTVSGTITGGGGIIKQGSGTQTLVGQQQFTGTTTIADGTLALGATGQLASGANVVVAGPGATFDISAAGNQTLGRLSGTGGSVNLGGNTLTFGDNTHQSLAASIAGAGGIVKTGAGTLSLTGQNTFTGAINVANGTVSLDSGGTLSGANNVSLAAGTTLDVTHTTTQTLIAGIDGAAGSTVSLGAQSLTFGGSANSTFDGVIAGAGGITKQGTATVTLGGVTTFSGTTSVTGGTLALGASGQLGGSAGLALRNTGSTFDASASAAPLAFASLDADTGTQLVLGSGGLITGDSGNHTFGGTLSGAGRLVKNGSGTLSLGASNTYAGGTTLNAGTLSLGNSTALGAGDITVNGNGGLGANAPASAPLTVANGVTLNNGATLGVAGASPLTLSGNVTGNGGLSLNTPQGITLAGNNRYTGGTTVTGGSVNVTSPTGLGTGGLVVSQGTVAMQGVDVTLPSLNGTAQGGVAINGGSVTVSAGDFSGSVAGSGGLTKTGTATTLTLSGQNPLTGPTTVAGGTLGIGSLPNSPVTVQADGTLTTLAPALSGGSGASAQTGTLTGGPGSHIVVASPGTTLGVNGDLTLAPGSTLQVSAAPGTAPSQVKASGRASVGGSNLVIHAALGTRPADASGAVIVSAPGGVSGQFASASTDLLYLTPQVSYTPTSVLLTFAPNGTPLPAGAITPNQRAAADAVAAMDGGSTLYQAALGLTAATAPAAFESLDGSLHASITSMLLSQSQIARDAVSQRLRENLSLAQDCEVSSAENERLPAPAAQVNRSGDCRAQPRATQAWASVYGNDGQLRGKPVADGGSGASTLHRRGMGVLAGVDAPLADAWRAGGFGGLGHSTFNTGPGASGNSNDAQIGAYVNRRFGRLGATIGGAYGWQQITSQRSVAIGPIAQTARASYDASVWQVFGEAAWRLDAGPASIEPFANVAYARVRTGAFDETGSVAALHADEQSQGITFSTAGLRGEMAFGTGSIASGRLRLSAGWRHAYGANTPDMRLAFSSTSAAFTVGGVPIARDAAVVSAGVDAFVGTAMTLGVSYSGQFGGQVSDNTIYGNLNWRF
ncbi:autotransporter-associated beta strand repeat-containing protein [Pandoraea bronchicola]|uniref:Glycine-rich autotransporter protein n=1 Tax=Pandoraea bronchicola TaxID=2508287 RepID=A0A5E5BKE5_9BURK|nr:autotransporter-associated beta strand repeat-containing protein [Pandoraea bronchicola]VVE86329.1 glycine-rich autotransporter protein [Pandoraea bronchicola]